VDIVHFHGHDFDFDVMKAALASPRPWRDRGDSIRRCLQYSSRIPARSARGSIHCAGTPKFEPEISVIRSGFMKGSTRCRSSCGSRRWRALRTDHQAIGSMARMWRRAALTPEFTRIDSANGVVRREQCPIDDIDPIWPSRRD
jgi:hypothetical protein